MTEIKKFSREWFVSKASNEQKQMAQNIGGELNTSIYTVLDKNNLVGKKDAVIKNYQKNLQSNNELFSSQANIIKTYGGIENLLNLIDTDGDGKITKEEIEALASVDNNEYAECKDTELTVQDLTLIYENVMASETCKLETTRNTASYTYEDGTKTHILTDKDGRIVSKSKQEETSFGGKRVVRYDYNEKTQYTMEYDKQGRSTYLRKDAPGRINDKTVITTYDDNNYEKTIKEMTEAREIVTTYDEASQVVSKDEKLRFKSDGIIGNTYQANIGNCWMLSGVNAINSTSKGREIIKDSIKQNNDGTYTVTLKGVGKSYTYTAEQVGAHDYLDYDKSFSSGDIDMNLLEMAITDYRKELKDSSIGFDNVRIDAANPLSGGFNREALFYLTGVTPENTYVSSSTSKMLDKKMADSERYAMTTSFSKADKEFTEGDIITGHTYSIKRVTEDTVYLINPWNSGKEIPYPKDKYLKNAEGISVVDYQKMK